MDTSKLVASDASMEPVYFAPGEGTHLSILGDEQWHKIKTEQTGGQICLFETKDAPGVGIPLHYHTTQDEVFYILEGAYDFTVGTQRIVAEAGASLFAPRNLPHAWKVAGERAARMLLMILPGGGEAMFHELHHAFANAAPEPQRVAEICARNDVFFLPPKE